MSPAASYDVVIVGGGTAGLVLAARLSENPNLQVAVIEAGPDETANTQVLTPGMWPLLSGSDLDWAFPTAPQEELTSPSLKIPQGRLLGGTSGINSFVFTPPSKDHVDAWAALGNEGWDYVAFEAALKRSYTLHTKSEASQGDGPLQLAVNISEPQMSWAKAWVDSLEFLGFPQCDAASGKVLGSFSTLESVYPQESRDVSRQGGTLATIKARKEVILSAGAINSPRLLEMSGIGGSELLQRLGIDVVIDNLHVGENLQNHVYTGVVLEARDDVETLDPFFRSEPDAVKAAMQAYAQGTGPLAGSSIVALAQLPFPGIATAEGKADAAQLVSQHLNPHSPPTTTFAAANEAYVRSVVTSPTTASANYLFGPAYTALEHPDPRCRAPGNHVSIGVMLSHPLSRGSVHLTSASPALLTGPSGVAIDPRYLTHPLDLEILARHVLFAAQAVATAPAMASHLKHSSNNPSTTLTDLDAARGAHHYVGTCAMLPRARGGVVDAQLRMHGCANLRVCDASVVPLAPTGNPQAVVYGVAEMGARMAREDLLGA